MTLSAGKRLGPYEILTPLGAGGMGEVYKARDIRLDRGVALKVLPAEVASDPDRLRRFEQEARAASALNHPNILSVYDVGSAGSISYIVTELVEGKTLRDLLVSGPLPVKKLLDLAVQIVDGLASAHEAGIIHRDLKPSNIMVSKEGFAKILDFGLAKVPTPAPRLDSTASDSTTEPISEAKSGAIVGTVDYMSPEQAAGKALDCRSDQFAMGSILYEMATGKRAFRRATGVETLAAILHEEPEALAQGRPQVPRPLAWIIERCLAKSPADRFVSTRDLSRDIRGLLDHLPEISGRSGEVVRPGRLSAPKPWWRAGILVLLAGVIVAGFALRARLARKSGSTDARSNWSLRPFSFLISAPDRTTFNFAGTSPAPAVLSPDGRRIVFGTVDSSGRSLLWVRSLEELAAKPLPGTENATYPFWARDSRFLAFFSDGKLRKIDADGGPAQVLSLAREGRGGDWNQSGLILFAPDNDGPLFATNADGGNLRQVTRENAARTEFNHRWPHFLPDGIHFVYLAYFKSETLGRSGIWIGSTRSADQRLLLPDLSNAAYAPPGFLLFVRKGSLMAARFDLDSLRITSEPIPILDQVSYHGYRWYGSFTVSRTGSLAFQASSASKAQLTWFARDGKPLGSAGRDADYGGLRISPDGEHCAVEIHDGRSGFVDIWTLDLKRGIADRLTSGGGNIGPVWSPDGNRIVFTSNRKGHWNLYVRNSSETDSDRALVRSDGDDTPTDWSPDGKLILYNHSSTHAQHKYEIWTFSVPEQKAFPYLQTSANERDGVFSPDGRFIAYESDESGQREIYVRRASSPGERWRVSPTKGSRPIWRRDGKELYYLSGNTVVAASLILGERLDVAGTRPLFEAILRDSPTNIPPYGVTRDGGRFLVVTSASDTPITVIPNWVAAFSRPRPVEPAAE